MDTLPGERVNSRGTTLFSKIGNPKKSLSQNIKADTEDTLSTESAEKYFLLNILVLNSWVKIFQAYVKHPSFHSPMSTYNCHFLPLSTYLITNLSIQGIPQKN